MHVLIVGGGIAGSVTALALQQAGIRATIFEAHVQSDVEVGSYFTIAPNGLDALAAVGARHLATTGARPTRRNVLWDASGHRLGAPGLGAPLADGTVAHTLKRATLTRRLLEEAGRRGIEVQTGRRLVDATTQADGRVVTRFEDGTEAIGDLLVGADGIHSPTRRIIDPAAPGGRYVGLTNFGGVTRGVDLDVERDAWHMIFGRRAFFGFHAGVAGEVVWFVNWPRPAIEADERTRTTEAGWRDQLSDLVRDDDGPAVELIRGGHLELAADNTFDLPHVPVWHRGAMVVVGDAAHAPSPTSGQGAAMAAEDGVVLAMALRDAPSIPAALAAYETARRARVERIVAYGARGSSAKVPGGVGRVVRDLAMRLVFRVFVTDRSMAWLYDHRIRWDQPLGSDPAAAAPAPARSGTR